MGLGTVTTGGGANTEVVHTIPAPSAECYNTLEAYSFSFDAAPGSAVTLTIESPSGTVIWHHSVTAAGAGPVILAGSGLDGALGQAIIVRLPAAAGCIGRLSTIHRNH